MWYKNIAGRFFGLVTKHTCDRETGGITTPKTALAQLRRAAKTISVRLSGKPQYTVPTLHTHRERERERDKHTSHRISGTVTTGGP